MEIIFCGHYNTDIDIKKVKHDVHDRVPYFHSSNDRNRYED